MQKPPQLEKSFQRFKPSSDTTHACHRPIKVAFLCELMELLNLLWSFIAVLCWI